jgi:AAA15 family ATPase/GTPase
MRRKKRGGSKMALENKQSEAKNMEVDINNLYLDPNNYRLIHEVDQINVTDDKIKDKDTVTHTYRLVLGEKNQNIQDLIESFKSNGYLPVDQIQVRILPDGGYVVVEGNRRIATLKFLNNEYNQKSIDLGKLDKVIFNRVPVVLYEDSDDIHHLTLMALKHISGNRKWGEWNQAMLLGTLSSEKKLPEDEICKRIGISKTDLRRNLRALGLANQYRDSDYGDQFNESMFPVFREACRNTALKEWLEWNDTTNAANHSANRDLLFSFLSREPVEEEDNDDDETDFSINHEDFYEPVILKRDDIRVLSKIIKDPEALENLTKKRKLFEAYRTSNLIFKEKIDNAIDSIDSDITILGQLSITPEQAPQLEEVLQKFKTIIEKTRSGNFQGVEQRSVFYDRIDKHFSFIKISAYRGFSDFAIKTISKVNLFAGVNNSGKTSLLEAIYLLCKQNDFNGLVDVLRRRGKMPEDHISSKWLSDQLSETIHIEGIFDNQQSNLELRPFLEENTSLDRTHYLKSIEISTRFEKHKLESMTRIFQGKGRETQADSIKILCKVVFSSPFFLNEPHHYVAFYDKAVQSKLLPKVLSFIREKVFPTIKDIRVADEFQRFLVIDDKFEKAMDLSSYGEGLQRIFFTSLLFASAENGVVLVDEFENAIHVELVETFATFVHTLAKEFNVQVFLTSHSKECIDAFIKTVPDNEKSDFTFHALVRLEDGNITSREFEGGNFLKLLEAGDVDLRRAQ